MGIELVLGNKKRKEKRLKGKVKKLHPSHEVHSSTDCVPVSQCEHCRERGNEEREGFKRRRSYKGRKIISLKLILR